MTSSPQELQLHTIDRTPEYEDFMNRLREYHAKRGTTLDPEPKVGLIHLDLFKVFNQIVANGGYDKVSEEKLAWRRMAAELGLFSNNEASTAFSLKEKFYKNLAAFEISTVHGKEPPPKDILEEVTAKGASLLTRTRENFRTKRDSGNVNTTDSAASGDDGTPARERPVAEKSTASSRASRGLREAPAQRVIFQPDTGSSRATRHSVNQQQHASHGTNLGMMQAPHLAGMNSMPPGSLNQGSRGPAILHHPPNSENSSQLVQSYQPKQLKPLPFRVATTPSSAPGDFSRPGLPRRPVLVDSESRQSIVPGTGCEGPNIYTRCMNALRSGLPAEEAFALSHLVKISYERGDKFKFDVFPGLAESLIDKALQVGNLFYHVDWTVSWDFVVDSTDVGCLDGNNGTPDILERIESLVEKDVLEVLQTESFSDKLVLIVEAILTIRNMVTLSENAQYMADCSPLKDLVCIILHLPRKDCVVELKHMALDIAEQLTPFMVLEADDALYTALLGQLASEDRGTILTALRALGRISMNLEATNALADVTVKSLQRITHWLLLNDDELIDACLDFLYQYTAVVANLENLVRSVAIEDLVEHLTRLLSHGARKTQKEWILFPEQRVPSRDEITPVPEDLLRELVKLEEPERVHRWVKCFFDEDDHSSVTQIAAWQAYQSAFSGPLEAAGKSLITPAEFIRNTTSVYKKSNAQVVRDPGEASQKFIIHGIRARARPLSIDGTEYGRCLWATNAEKKNEKCGQFCLKPEQMAEHILMAHLSEKRNAEGKFTNVEREFRCTWGECFKYEKATEMRLRDFVRHINTHILALLPGAEAQMKRHLKPWVMPAKMISMACEETMTVRDETNTNPHAAPEAAGIPLSAVLVLRNIARNVVKTDAEEELVKQQQTSGGERGGWNERLFRPVLRRLFDILTKNRALSPYIASLLDLIRTNWEVSEESIA